MDISVRNKDYNYMVLYCDKSISEELKEFFSFESKDSNFKKQHIKGWDGVTRLFNSKNNTLPKGLLFHLYKFANIYGYKIKVDPKILINKEINDDSIDKWIDTLNITSNGKSITPYDYQRDILNHTLKFDRATFLAATSAGKSLAIYLVARYWQQFTTKNKILILAPSTNLVEQMYGDFDDYSKKDSKWSAEDNCHIIYYGHEKTSEKKIFISTWQSIYEFDKSYFDQFDAIIVDEVHGAKAASITNIMRMIPSNKRIGLTGTLDETELHHLQIEGMFGKIKQIIKTHELQSSGRASQTNIECLLLDHSDIEVKKALCNMRDGLMKIKAIFPFINKPIKSADQTKKYTTEINYLITNKKRNLFIMNLAKRLNGNTLILLKYVDAHGKILEELFNNELNNTHTIFFISGEMKGEERNNIRTILENSENNIVIATYDTVATGWSVKNLHNLIYASPIKAKIKTLQSLGRLLRLHDSKDSANIYDIGDDLSYDDEYNYTLKHFKERIRFYIEEKLKYKIRRINL